MTTEPKEITWFNGRKLIDKWYITPELLGSAYDGAITPIMVTDKHGNIWNMGVTRCDLILKANMVRNIKKDYDTTRELLDL